MNIKERERLALQAELDAQKTQSERNSLGQFATPTGLARDILTYATGLLPPKAKVRFFDPGLGTGSFYSALVSTMPMNRIESAVGFEIDSHYSKPARRLWEGSRLSIVEQDYTRAALPSDESDRFNLLISNPPYVRHHHISSFDKPRLQSAAEYASGVRVSGLAGLYCYFLALSHAWMTRGGVAGWLIPSEFMDVNYGRAIKRYLLTKVNLLRIHRFDPNEVQFDDALVSSAVVFFRKELPPADSEVEFTYGGTVVKPKLSKKVRSADLADEQKWTRFPASDVRSRHAGVKLGDLFQIKRGLATGDNKFFILTREQIAERRLPFECFKPILPSPRYLQTDHVVADEEGHPKIEKQLFLLDCNLSEDEIKIQYRSLWEYLSSRKADVGERYLCRHRKPWYSQENRPASPFLCTYLGRSDKKNGKPFRFIFNETQATAANVYLMLYPKSELADAITSNKKGAHQVWKFLNEITPDDLLGEGRVYGGGLHKLEPKELANVAADKIVEKLNISLAVTEKQADMLRDYAG